MLRRTSVSSNIWSKYRFSHALVPKAEGPPPLDAPVTMNRTKTHPHFDPINDSFPRTIRGNTARPDVPDNNYVNQWYFLYTTTATGELFPWTSTAPEGSFRFRPHSSELNAIGREQVKALRETDRLRLPDGSFRNVQRGPKSFPSREAYLTQMNSSSQPETSFTGAPSPCTIMDRARKERYQGIRHQTPLEQQLDVGRHEPVPAIAASIPVDKRRFPYNWNTEDWYEWEIANTRLQRFKYENAPSGAGSNPHSSEVTYKIITTSTWEHHARPFADDICAFLREVGRQLIEEKLVSIRQSLLSVRSGQIDEELRAAYKLNEADEYSDDEIRMHQQRELEQLESECVHTLGLINASSSSDQTDHSDASSAWPVIEDMEPWTRMVEFWGERADTTFANAEMSTRKFEFRKFFKIIKVKMPFQSTELEKRIYDIRHWGHKQMDLEFHTIHKKNLVHDQALFPVERDPFDKTSHEHHRMFSFALDWHQAPANFVTTTEVGQNEASAEMICERLGCSLNSLKQANPKVFKNNTNSKKNDGVVELKQGTIINIPRDSTKRLASTSVTAKKVRLSSLRETIGSSSLNWENVAKALDCTVQELQTANGEALATYSQEENTFGGAIEELNSPSSILSPAYVDGFSSIEPTFINDSFESIAQRLGCSVDDLKKVNSTVEDPSKVTHVAVPPSARTPRRQSDPLLRNAETTGNEHFTRLKGEMLPHSVNKDGGIPDTIPHEPAYAKEFPGEFADGAGSYPQNPGFRNATNDWLSYTATYLDPELSAKAEPTPKYNVNRVWPVQSVPGSMQQEPFQEDQTWLLHRLPIHVHEVADPESDIKGLSRTNEEHLPQSMEWRAP